MGVVAQIKERLYFLLIRAAIALQGDEEVVDSTMAPVTSTKTYTDDGGEQVTMTIIDEVGELPTVEQGAFPPTWRK
jgi:hypothetical protein